MDAEVNKIAAALDGIVNIQSHLVGMGKPRATLAERIIKSDQLAAFVSGRAERFKLDLPLVELKSITSTGTANDPLVASGKPYIDAGVRQPLTLRGLLPAYPTENGAIELPIKTAATNNAGEQGANSSPELYDSAAFGESAFTFESGFVPVRTLGHTVPVSKSVLEDSGTFDSFIRGELLYGLAEKVEDQLLNGTGNGGELSGLLASATALTQSSPLTTSEMTVVRMAIKQIQLAGFSPSAVVLNPADWFDIETTLSGTGNAAYVAGDPSTIGSPRLWGLPVVLTNAMSSGSFLVLDARRCAALFERQTATVEIGRHEGTNFSKGMITLLAMERIALVATNATAMVKGSL